MKIAVVCITWLRPKQLGRMIWCYERQTHQDREMVILDDAHQYAPTSGDQWKLVSCPCRISSLGAKRNIVTDLASAEAIAVWDDDDLYLPRALEATAAALHYAPLSRPSLVLHPDDDGNLRQHATGGLFQSGWGYLRSAFDQAGGYPHLTCGEDQGLLRQFVAAGIKSVDPMALGYRPFMVYDWWNPETPHLSTGRWLNWRKDGGTGERVDIRPFIVKPPIDLDDPKIMPGVFPRAFDPEMKRFPVIGQWVTP